MTKITINCKCGKQFKVKITGEGIVKCNHCKLVYRRYFNQKTDTYEFDIEKKS